MRVAAAAAIQEGRPAQIRATCNADMTARDVLHTTMRRLHLSARAYHRVLKVSRTIANLDATSLFDKPHAAEVLKCHKSEDDRRRV